MYPKQARYQTAPRPDNILIIVNSFQFVNRKIKNLSLCHNADVAYVKCFGDGRDSVPQDKGALTLSGLSIKGTIILPSEKGNPDEAADNLRKVERYRLMKSAKGGNEDAIEELTMQDMDLYSEVSRRVGQEDLYSIVYTSIMPYGVECDQYNVLGEIVKVRRIKNNISNEEVCILTLLVNDLTFDVAINIMDLLGEPKPGRRFKGIVWLQGRINYPSDDEDDAEPLG